MHIPDGYLSPSTCATLYAFSMSGWYLALRRVKRALATRTIPLISVFAAFSFVIMMFNIPLPGGTTGHALGVTIAAIVLGPWGSILAVSVALAIQALFFGDGGITTLGANCFNMAIVGSLVAYGVYRALSSRSEVTARRRVVAAGVAGYISINIAAFLTALEFGIQPMLFHDTGGTPLYAPYPLHVAIPAMMIGHLTFAGLAEALIAAGMVSYLQRADVGLLRGAQDFLSTSTPLVSADVRSSSPTQLWWIVGCLMVCTPAGILAAGAAWGEWSSADMANPHTRAYIEAVSGNHKVTQSVPAGLQKWSTVWTAPFPAYAPRFIKSPAFGYLLSAIFGVGLLVLAAALAARITRRAREPESQS
ncbi:MAG TPA: cobalt transporter CbiM [Terriglobales bacterium]|nr:cobalt transporter CbiM [Terriglobales bacterium]